MEIRPATDSDVPAIVSLLKSSLGESLMPKSESFWNWKHNQNPFGKSPVLLAFENNRLVGVRAFMRWEWRDQSRIYKAVRAVDTATHPDFQGKGIFKKLTLQLVDQCKEEGVDFVFNTPNKSSKPGYLKMGWQSAGRLPIMMKLHLGISRGLNSQVTDSWDGLDGHPLLQSGQQVNRGPILTSTTAAYFAWRYKQNPNVDYRILSSTGPLPFILIYRLKAFSKMTEVRITDLIAPDAASRRFALNQLGSVVRPFSIMSISGGDYNDFKVGFIPVPLGPVVTIRNLNLREWPENLSFEKWSPSLGDLELF